MSVRPEHRGLPSERDGSLHVGVLRSALESVPYAMAYVTSGGICEFANAALRAVVGHRGRVPDRTPLELVFGPPAGQRIRRGIESCGVSGVPEDVTVSLPGLEFPARVRITADTSSPEGADGHFVTVVPERLANAESAEDLRVAFEALNTAVILVDDDFRLVRWNRAFEDLGIASQSQLRTGTPLREALVALTRMAKGGGGPRGTERPAFDPKGTPSGSATFRVAMPPAHRVVEGESLLLPDGRVVIAFSDVTEAASARDELSRSERLRTIGQLTGGIAHDFNNLLAVIVGNLDLLEDGSLFGEREELVSAAKRAALRGSALTGALLSYGRGSSTRVVMRTSVEETIRSLERIVRRVLGGAVLIETSVSPGTHEVHVNPGLLENALLNLALNARDAMPHGGRIVISTENIRSEDGPQNAPAGPRGWVRVTVRDTGDGMRPDVKARALDPFFTTKEEGRGTGLGLSMVQRFVYESRGHLEIESALGEGTSVTMFLPAIEPGEPGEVEEPIGTPAMGEGRHVLLVEDNPSTRNTFRSMLQRLDYRVTDVDSGEVALKLLEGPGRFEVLLADVQVPGGMGGVELVRRISSIRPDLRSILISGHPDAHRPFGIPLVSKPCRLHDLATELARAIDEG